MSKMSKSTKKSAKKVQAKKSSKVQVKKAKEPAKKPPHKPAKVTSSPYPRHEKNAFREGSSYSTAFDLLASRKSGIRRDEAVKLLAEATGKDIKHAGYDLAVLCSAKESVTGPRHKSCKEGFWIMKENDHLLLRF